MGTLSQPQNSLWLQSEPQNEGQALPCRQGVPVFSWAAAVTPVKSGSESMAACAMQRGQQCWEFYSLLSPLAPRSQRNRHSAMSVGSPRDLTVGVYLLTDLEQWRGLWCVIAGFQGCQAVAAHLYQPLLISHDNTPTAVRCIGPPSL